MIGLWYTLTFLSIVRASPNVFLPINSQVPPVARANEPFKFTFAETTFIPSAGSVIYTISDAPGWLQLDGATRTFHGTPSPSSSGSFVVNLMASDESPGSTTMPVTFVVSTNKGPSIKLSVADQLSTHNGFSSFDSLLVPHSTPLSLSFSSNTFTNTNENTLYYAICANNTPLPSWIIFDPNDLSFSGMAPLTELPQTYQIEMTASDVAGFAGAVAIFSVVVVSHMFAFGSSHQVVNITAGSPVRYSVLENSLSLNGQPINTSLIESAKAATPSWLSMDPNTLVLSGTPPPGVVAQNITVNATDIYGDMASTAIWLQTASCPTAGLLGFVPTLTANVGSNFIYDLNRTLTNTSAVINLVLGKNSSWLSFDSGTSELKGHVPVDLTPGDYTVNVTASLGSKISSQILTIDVQSPVAPASSTTSSHSSAGSSSSSSSPEKSSASGGGILGDKRWIALPVLLPIVVLAVASLLLFCCYKRRRKRATYYCESSEVSSRLSVNGPVHNKSNIEVEEGAFMSGALTSHKTTSSMISKPPMVDIPEVLKSFTTRRNSQFRASQASAEGGGRMSRADSWYRYTMNFDVGPRSALFDTAAVIDEEKSPRNGEPPGRHKSKVPDFPHFSVSSRSSRTHAQSRSRQTHSNMSFGSSAFFSSQLSGFGHGRSISSQSSGGNLLGTRGIGHGHGGGPPGYNIVRDSWRSFRFVSLISGVDGNPSNDGEANNYALAHPPPLPNATRKIDKSTIRLVRSSSRSHLHRRSTIHSLSTVNSTNSTTRRYPRADPLQEFHRRRLLHKKTDRGLFTAGPSSARISSYTASLPRSPSKSRNKSLRPHSSLSILPTTPENHSPEHDAGGGGGGNDDCISETSSISALSPLARSSPSKSSIYRPLHLRHSTYSTSGPAVRLPLIGRSNSNANTVMSDDQDSRWESASSDAQSMDPYMYSREVNNGHRETALFDSRDAAARGSPGVVGGGGVQGFAMEQFARGLRGLGWQRAERGRVESKGGGLGEDDEEQDGEEGERGRRRRRGGRREEVKMGGGESSGKKAELKAGESGNLSFRGEIRKMDDEGGSAFV